MQGERDRGFIERLDERTEHLLNDVAEVARRQIEMERQFELVRSLVVDDHVQLRTIIRDEMAKVRAANGWEFRDTMNVLITLAALGLSIVALFIAKSAV